MVAPLIDPYTCSDTSEVKRLRGSGRAGHNKYRRRAGERSSVLSKSQPSVTVRKPQQCHRALAGNLGKNRGRHQAPKLLTNSDTEIRISPLAAVVTGKVRIIDDLSFDVKNGEKKVGENGDTDPDTIPQCLCTEALPKY